MSAHRCHGLLAEFADAAALLDAVRELRRRGYDRLQAYTPYAVDGLADALDAARVPFYRSVSFWVLLGGIFGGIGTFALQTYAAVFDYPIDVGGRPDFSWPAFLPPSLEMTLLFAAVFGIVAMLAGNGLPRLHHPLFALPRFERASQDALFVLVRAEDARFDDERTPAELRALGALRIDEVPA